MKRILVLIDVQNDFITGSLRNEEAIKTVPNIVEKVKNFEGDYIFLTQDTHSEDYMATKEGEKLPVVHCIDGTEGWEIEPSVAEEIDKKRQDDKIIVETLVKPTFASFDLAREIAKIPGELDIEFVGFCTDICVVSNALLVKGETYNRANIKVDASCCAGVTVETHNAALLTMKMCQIDVINQ